MIVREIDKEDFHEWLRMRTTLWPDSTAEEIRTFLSAPRSNQTVFVIDQGDGGLAGFIEMGSRKYAEYCLTSPVAYIEGWYVDEALRRNGLGALLVKAGEDWARDNGYREIASDSDIMNDISIAAHKALGYTEVCRQVCFRKEF